MADRVVSGKSEAERALDEKRRLVVELEAHGVDVRKLEDRPSVGAALLGSVVGVAGSGGSWRRLFRLWKRL